MRNNCGTSPIIKLIIWLLSICISLLISVSLFVITVNTVGYIYELKHPISSEDDDLGAGLVMLFYASIAFSKCHTTKLFFN